MASNYMAALILSIAVSFVACGTVENRQDNAGVPLGKIKHDSLVCEPLANAQRTLCAVNTTNEGPRWYLIGPFDAVSLNIDSEFVVFEINASPDGRYVAICSASEGHPVIQVIDAGQLSKIGVVPVLHSIPFGSGWIEIVGWQGDELLISSDYPLTELPGDVIDSDVTRNYGLHLESGNIRLVH